MLNVTLDENIKCGFPKIVIIDGFSTDNSIEIVKKKQIDYPDKIDFYQFPKKGLANARNQGNLKSTTEYVMHAGPDNIIPLETLQNLIKQLVKYDLVSCQTRLKMTDDYISRAQNIYKKRYSVGEKEVVGTPYIAKRELFIKYFFDEQMLNSDDTDLCTRLKMAGKNIYRSESICYEVGFNDIHSIFERWMRWGRGDVLFYLKWKNGWTLKRKIRSLMRPFIAEIAEPFKILKKSEFFYILPFLILVCSLRYLGWMRYLIRKK